MSTPVFQTFLNELHADGLNALKPLERIDIAEGVALPDEVKQIVANRSGRILSASTILKSDMFSNLQKLSLPERIEGAPNFRRLPLIVNLSRAENGEGLPTMAKMVCGSGMPTQEGCACLVLSLKLADERSVKVEKGVITVERLLKRDEESLLDFLA